MMAATHENFSVGNRPTINEGGHAHVHVGSTRQGHEGTSVITLIAKIFVFAKTDRRQ